MKKLFCFVLFLSLGALVAAVPGAQTCGTNAGSLHDTSATQAEKPQGVEIMEDTAFVYCALEMTGSYDQHSAAFETLYTEAAKQGIYGGTPFGVYWNSPSNTPVEKLKWDVGFAMRPGQTLKEPLKLKKWHYTRMAALEYSGPFAGEGLDNAYNQIFKWIRVHGYKPAGPVMEQYLNVPSPDEKGVLVGRVEILVPVEKVPAVKEKKAK